MAVREMREILAHAVLPARNDCEEARQQAVRALYVLARVLGEGANEGR